VFSGTFRENPCFSRRIQVLSKAGIAAASQSPRQKKRGASNRPTKPDLSPLAALQIFAFSNNRLAALKLDGSPPIQHSRTDANRKSLPHL
jgi:hypothetical protein